MAAAAILLVLLLATLAFLSFACRKRGKFLAGSLPSPPGWLPIIGHLHQLGKLPHRSLASIAYAKGLPVMLLRLGSVPAVIISSAEAAQEALRARDHAFSSRPPSRAGDALFYNCTDVGFCPYGDYWRQFRRICVVHLLSSKRVLSFRAVRKQEVTLMIESIRRISAAGTVAVDVSDHLVNLTNGILCRAAMGRKYVVSGRWGIKQLIEMLSEVVGTTAVGDFLPWLGWLDKFTGLESRLRSSSETMDRYLQKVIDDHRKKREYNPSAMLSSSSEAEGSRDFVDVLLSVAEEDKDVGFAVNDIHIKAVMMDMFAAGTDTSYAVLEWTMAELIRHPEVMTKLRDEVRAVVGHDDSSDDGVREEDLENMRYLKCVIKESLRLHPPLPLVPKETIEDTTLLGYRIPAKTRVMINVWAIGRDPKRWERAEEFWPERFSGGNPTASDIKAIDFGFIPFGAGRRGCPGISFAAATMELALASLMYHFDWKLPDGKEAEMLDMKEAPGLDVHKKEKLLLLANPASSP